MKNAYIGDSWWKPSDIVTTDSHPKSGSPCIVIEDSVSDDDIHIYFSGDSAIDSFIKKLESLKSRK